MRDRHSLLLVLALGALTLTGCARAAAPSATSPPPNQIRPGMTEAEIIQLLGPPVLVTEQPAERVSVPGSTGVESREKRRYTYYYLGPSQDLDTLITLEDGIVINTGKKPR
jgi:hypothetical protein